MKILDSDFFNCDTISLAKKLLGKYVVVGDKVGRIVETEAYLQDDPGSHTFKSRTSRNESMFGRAGKAYVYFTYGMYHCFNVVANKEGKGEAVLIRAVEPVGGIDEMMENRAVDDVRNLTNGPAKFCIAFRIDRSFNEVDLLDEESGIVLMEGDEEEFDIVETTRIGIREGADLPYRFYVKGSEFVSRK